jgi:trigger factor
MRQEAMKYGPQAQQVFDLFRQNANAQAQLRAPIFEDKVVEHILEQAKPADKKVSVEELMKPDEDTDAHLHHGHDHHDHGHDHTHDHDHDHSHDHAHDHTHYRGHHHDHDHEQGKK